MTLTTLICKSSKTPVPLASWIFPPILNLCPSGLTGHVVALVVRAYFKLGHLKFDSSCSISKHSIQPHYTDRSRFPRGR